MRFKINLICLMLVIFTAMSTVFSDYPDKKFTEYIFVDEEKVKLEDGLDFSGKDWLGRGKNMYGIQITRQLGTLKNINFDDVDMQKAYLDETIFEDCSFRGANMIGITSYAGFENCDFTDTLLSSGIVNGHLNNTTTITLNKEAVAQTKSYKLKNLCNIRLSWGALDGFDLSGFDLRNSSLNVTNCNLTDALISGSRLTGMTQEQLMTTKDYRGGELLNVQIYNMDLSGLDLSDFNLTGCRFGSIRNVTTVTDVDFTGAIITKCDFWSTNGLTLNQIKSTWNYKVGRMDGVILPEKLQKELDAEKGKEEK